MKVNIYIGFCILKMECTQYGICGEVAFKNARIQRFFLKNEQDGQKFRADPKNLGFFVGQLTLPASTSPKGS